MAIDPSIITTVRADQLPVAPLTGESIIMHAIGETLYQATISELISLLPTAAYKPYETKVLNVTDLYIDQNFTSEGPTAGLGKSDGLWSGWAIINGNNGTAISMDNAVVLGYGATRNTMREPVGENTKALVKNNIPVMDVTLEGSSSDNGDPGNLLITSPGGGNGIRTYTGTVNKLSTNTPISIQQKSFVQLFIMKLP